MRPDAVLVLLSDVHGNLPALAAALERPSERAHVVVARTDPARGVPLLAERAPLLHTLRLGGDEERARYQEVLETMTEGALDR